MNIEQTNENIFMYTCKNVFYFTSSKLQFYFNFTKLLDFPILVHHQMPKYKTRNAFY